MNTLTILGIIGGTLLIGLLILIKYGYRYWANEELKNRALPGDELILKKDAVLHFTKSIEINAPAEEAYKYLAQQGQHKAGFYSWDRLERLFTFKIYNTYHIVPEWTKIKIGDWMPYHQIGIGSEIMEVKEGHYFTMLSDSRKKYENKGMKAFGFNPIPGGKYAWTWNFIVEPINDNKCVFIQRCYNSFSPNNILTRPIIRFAIGLPSIVMTSKQSEWVKACAEGNPPK